jgi:alkylation response protein AidB-like acyl-CoA dehydrogenase
VHDIAGGTSVYKDSALQRRLRDAQTMTQHMITNAATYEMTGRVLLGGYHPGMQL